MPRDASCDPVKLRSVAWISVAHLRFPRSLSASRAQSREVVERVDRFHRCPFRVQRCSAPCHLESRKLFAHLGPLVPACEKPIPFRKSPPVPAPVKRSRCHLLQVKGTSPEDVSFQIMDKAGPPAQLPGCLVAHWLAGRLTA